MMKKKVFLGLLVSALLLAGCAKKEETPVTDLPTDTDVTDVTETEPDDDAETEDAEEASEEKEPIDYEGDLSTEKYDGYEYRMLVRKGYSTDHYFEEAQDDTVYDAIYRRNKAVEERFGCTISCTESAESNTDTSALNSILAGDDAYDIIFTHCRSAFAYAVQGACYNVCDIKSIRMDKPWWAQDIRENCTINGRQYILDGDISIGGLNQAMCMFFNKRIFDELGFEYPYDMVRDGEWTFDQFAYLAKKGGKDLNGDGVMTGGDDQFGYLANDWYSPINILYAGGERIYSKGEDDLLHLSLYSNKTVSIFDSFFNLLSSESCVLAGWEGDNVPSFYAGNVMFTDGFLGAAKAYRGMDDDFGILPFPKYDEDDDYHTATNGVADLAVLPMTISDPERTGAITEALAAYGSEYVIPAFYDVSLKTKFSRDEESEEMMDIIRGGRVFDVGYLGGSVYANLGLELASKSSHDFSSWYAANESAANKALEDFNKAYGGAN